MFSRRIDKQQSKTKTEGRNPQYAKPTIGGPVKPSTGPGPVDCLLLETFASSARHNYIWEDTEV